MKDMEKKKQPEEVQKFYWPGTDKRILVNKRLRHCWRNCHYIRRSSWIVIPVLIFTSPWLLIPWIIIHAFASVLLWGEEVVEAQKEGFETPPSWDVSYSGFGGLFGDLFF